MLNCIIREAARSMTSMPPHSSTIGPTNLDAQEIAKMRKLLERAKNDFKGTPPRLFIMTPTSPPNAVERPQGQATYVL